MDKKNRNLNTVLEITLGIVILSFIIYAQIAGYYNRVYVAVNINENQTIAIAEISQNEYENMKKNIITYQNEIVQSMYQPYSTNNNIFQ